MGCGSDETDSQQPGFVMPGRRQRPAVAVNENRPEPAHEPRNHTARLLGSATSGCVDRATTERVPREPRCTEIQKDNTRKTVSAVDEESGIRLFYVYPTVSIGGTGEGAGLTDISATLDPLLNQAAPFAGLCEIYAPPLPPGLDRARNGRRNHGAGDVNLAFGDVEAAFQYYVDHLNQGRKFVLMGHSQGTLTLTRLVSQRIDPDPTLRAQLISALLIGGAVVVPRGPAGRRLVPERARLLVSRRNGVRDRLRHLPRRSSATADLDLRQGFGRQRSDLFAARRTRAKSRAIPREAISRSRSSIRSSGRWVRCPRGSRRRSSLSRFLPRRVRGDRWRALLGGEHRQDRRRSTP